MIQLKDLTLGYEQRTLLEKVSAHITGGQLVALLGRNGTGKSTLLRAVMGLEKPQNGEIILHGNNIASLKPEELARNISFVTTDKVRIANLRCRDVVALGRAPYTNWLGQLQGEDKEKVDNAMHLVGMDSYAEKTMDKMSDGECQRIMIARALAQDTPVILLDEPTAFLDLPNRYELCLLLRKLTQKEGKCILFSTHDLDIALSLCDTIMLIDNPQLYSLPTNEMITSGHIERLFHNESITFDAQAMKIRITVLGMVFSAIFVITDGIFVGKGIGSDALAAVNITAPLFMIATGIGLMFGVGGSVVASIYLSQGKRKAANINITQALVFSTFIVLVMSALCFCFVGPLGCLLGSSDRLLPLVIEYMIWYLPFLVFYELLSTGMFFIRLDGSPNYAMM